jgi:hypothetical protein
MERNEAASRRGSFTFDMPSSINRGPVFPDERRISLNLMEEFVELKITLREYNQNAERF